MEIGVVLVTYNRLEKLKIALKAYDKQTIQPKYILVVDNKSTDGTKEYLESWKKEESTYQKYTVFMEENTGGSGGFYEALQHSLNLDASWIWTADDDAYPQENAFEIATNYLIQKTKEELDNISAICGAVLKSDAKSIDCSHRRRIYKGAFHLVKQPYSKQKDYKKEEFEIEGFSYVGTFINKEKFLKYNRNTDRRQRNSGLTEVHGNSKIRSVFYISEGRMFPCSFLLMALSGWG